MSEGKKIYIGIDLGTTNTLVSYVKGGKRKQLIFDGRTVLPSVLYMDTHHQDEISIGSTAIAKAVEAPYNRVSSSKTYMGTDKKYELTLSDGSRRVMTPTDVAAEILKAVKSKAVKKFKLEEEDEIYAVITTPAAFSFNQNEETIRAAKMAGLHVLGTRPEPIAAAAACMDNMEINGKANVFVVDIGGGTYDTAVIGIDENFNPRMMSAEGDRQLGGDDFDRVIFDYFKFELEDESTINLDSQEASGLPDGEYHRTMFMLRDCATEVKIELTRADKVRITRNNMYKLNGVPQQFETTLTRAKFDELCSDLYKKIEKRLDESIRGFQKKGIDLSDITHLVLVGGSCYIPAVIELVRKKIGILPMQIADKTTAVAEGAAKIADEWTTLGESLGGVVAQSMGVRVEGGKFDKIICKAESYPCKHTKQYETTRDNQTQIRVCVYAAAPDKEHISEVQFHDYYGSFLLDNIKPGPRGATKIDVTFEFDDSQRLTVTAQEVGSDNTRQIVINKDEVVPEEDLNTPCALDLLIDVSGSMKGDNLNDAKHACRRMISEIVNLETNVMGITAFNDTQINICPIVQDKKRLLDSVDKMEAKYTTKMGKGIEFSANKLAAVRDKDLFIIMMTDGAPDWGDKSEKIAKEIREKYHIRLVVIYIGSIKMYGYDYAQKVAQANLLSGETKPMFYHSENMANLGEIFKNVYADIKLSK